MTDRATTEPRPVDALADDELAQVAGGVQKVREALTDDDLDQVAGGESLSLN